MTKRSKASAGCGNVRRLREQDFTKFRSTKRIRRALVVTKDELDELLTDCPVLYHMTARDSWPSIQTHGLLSTTALLDRYGIVDADRVELESRRRASSIVLSGTNLPGATLRDQLPMDDDSLRRCLLDGLSPEQWYKILNGKVFFWLTRERLIRLSRARTYRRQDHDVLEIDAKALVAKYAEKISFCAINSGCAKPFPSPRGKSTFLPISQYPYANWRKVRKPGERVVELTIDYAAPDIADYTKRVVRMNGSTEIQTL